MPPITQKTVYKVTTFEVLSRCLVWMISLFRFNLAVFWDRLRGKDTDQQRGERMFKTMLGIGGTVVKIGQVLAMRVDLLPSAYCKELAKLLDSMEPFPAEIAIDMIERAHRRPLHEVY